MTYMANDPPCGVCGTVGNRRCHSVREMMFGTRETFKYAECPHCGALELLDPPADPSHYYPEDYNQEHDAPVKVSAVKKLVARRRAAHLLGRPGFVGQWLAKRYVPPVLRWMSEAGMTLKAEVLDVGCGRATLLRELATAGLRSLTGIDPFVDPRDTGRVRIIREDIFSHRGAYDAIMFHHSFEHMDRPLQVLERAKRLLKPGGAIWVRIPVADSLAWRHYGVHWVQLDAPRHCFLHTSASMAILAVNAGLRVVGVDWDSNEFQFVGSELYQRNIPLILSAEYGRPGPDQAAPIFTSEERADFAARAVKLNESGEGDQACFWLVHE